MAARLNRLDTERVLMRIKASKLVERLQKFAMDELYYPTGGTGGSKPGELVKATMSPEQVRAACFLVERLIARAENPRDINVSGHISLESLIASAAAKADDESDRSSDTAH
jgi:hypothetical protein